MPESELEAHADAPDVQNDVLRGNTIPNSRRDKTHETSLVLPVVVLERIVSEQFCSDRGPIDPFAAIRVTAGITHETRGFRRKTSECAGGSCRGRTADQTVNKTVDKKRPAGRPAGEETVRKKRPNLRSQAMISDAGPSQG